MIDYTVLLTDHEAICPCCGKLLKPKEHLEAQSTFGEDPDYITYFTYSCKDCRVKISTHYAELDDPDAYTIPKDYEVTVTKPQIRYIRFLANHFYQRVWRMPIILNKEVAREWISQFDTLYREEIREFLYNRKVEKLMNKEGYRLCAIDQNNVFVKKYKYEDIQVKVEVIISKDKMLHTHNVIEYSEQASPDNVKKVFSEIDKDTQAIKESINMLNEPDNEEVSIELENRKARARYSHDNLDAGGDFDTMFCDPWDHI